MIHPKIRWPRWNYVRIHYAFVLGLSILGMVILYPAKNMSAIDAFFQAVSAATVTGLNVRDHMDMETYQQVILYIWPLLGQLQFINTMVVLVRLHWFRKKFKDIVCLSRYKTADRRRADVEDANNDGNDAEDRPPDTSNIRVLRPITESSTGTADAETSGMRHRGTEREGNDNETPEPPQEAAIEEDETTGPAAANSDSQTPDKNATGHITFSPETYNRPTRSKALRVPGPREFEKGHRLEEVDADSDDDLAKTITCDDTSFAGPSDSAEHKKPPALTRILSRATSIEQAASSAFILGDTSRRVRSRSISGLSRVRTATVQPDMPYLSYTPTVGRNSIFVDLTPEQRDELGGIEYRSLRLLAKITSGYYVFFHLFGAICLLIWIHATNQKYRDELHESAVKPTWWAFYSGMTTFNNLGFTLNPTSMVPFRDATFPMLLMIFLMWIGNTAYPCMLRFLIWTAFKIVPKNSAIKEPLNFLLDHPRRCYTLLFPSGPTWVLFAYLVLLNGIDVILFMILDLKNEEMTSINSGWNRFLAGLFHTTSTRTTGTTTFAVSGLHPAIQLTLVVMMYISAYPIAMSVRKTNTYEETSLGVYTDQEDEEVDENNRASYLSVHMKKQLAFDLWYVFLGVFIVAIAEGGKLANDTDPDFSLFSIIFECVSAYGNVGMSMGHSDVNTSLAGKCSTVSKLVFCALMVRGRHRELPYELDRAIVLPREKHLTDEPLLHEHPSRMRRVCTH